MKRFNLSWVVLTSVLFVPAVGSSQQISCVRGGLQRAVNLYIEAQTKGDTSGLPLANGLGYYENNERIDIAGGVIKTLQPGYELLGRLVRPAMVVVAAKGSTGETPGGADPAAAAKSPYAANEPGGPDDAGASVDRKA